MENSPWEGSLAREGCLKGLREARTDERARSRERGRGALASVFSVCAILPVWSKHTNFAARGRNPVPQTVRRVESECGDEMILMKMMKVALAQGRSLFGLWSHHKPEQRR